jgi:hypothetical protein
MGERGRMYLWMTLIAAGVIALAVLVFMNYVAGIRGA